VEFRLNGRRRQLGAWTTFHQDYLRATNARRSNAVIAGKSSLTNSAGSGFVVSLVTLEQSSDIFYASLKQAIVSTYLHDHSTTQQLRCVLVFRFFDVTTIIWHLLLPFDLPSKQT